MKKLINYLFRDEDSLLSKRGRINCLDGSNIRLNCSNVVSDRLRS